MRRRAAGKSTRTSWQARLKAIKSPPEDDAVLSSGDVARLLNVTTKTVWRWETTGRLPSTRTIGGHRRYRWAHVKRWLSQGGPTASE
jgi:excisionase family DNA binding protein